MLIENNKRFAGGNFRSVIGGIIYASRGNGSKSYRIV